jgi:hypothetical protein
MDFRREADLRLAIGAFSKAGALSGCIGENANQHTPDKPARS